MLVCSSSDMVNRILSIERWKFGEVKVMADRWISVAGRSAVMAANETTWVVARGIPLHIRSKAMFEVIGNRCGGFIRAEEGSSLSSVRIKISMTETISEEVLARFDSVFYPIRIEMEGIAPLSMVGVEPEFFQTWKEKGRGIEVRPVHVPTTGEKDLPSCSKGPVPVSEKVDIGESPMVSSEELVDINADISVRTLIYEQRGQLDDVPLVVGPEVSDLVRSNMAYMGLKVNNKEELCLVSGRGELESTFRLDFGPNGPYVSRPGRSWSGDNTHGNGMGLPLLKTRILNSSVDCWMLGEPKWRFSILPSEGSLDPMSFSSVRGGTSYASLLEGSQGMLSPSLPLIPDPAHVNSLGVGPSVPSEDVGLVCQEILVDSAPEPDSEEDRLWCSVQEVASSIGLSLNGDPAQSLIPLREACKEVSKRKSRSTPRSRTDREHRRLGVSPEALPALLQTSERGRCISPCVLPDEL
ncbi:hypothetical protein LINPERHAP2_LOCUS29202 [Linum perenne]